MQGYDVVTSDDHKIGTVVDTRDNCLIVEHGHVFKTRNAVPLEFAHVDEATHVVRVTVAKDVFGDSPKVDDGWTCEATHTHYGLIGEFEVDPDPNDPDKIADDHTQERVATLQGDEPATATPRVRERQANAYDPAGDTANLR
jgi:hypothetical protein